MPQPIATDPSNSAHAGIGREMQLTGQPDAQGSAVHCAHAMRGPERAPGCASIDVDDAPAVEPHFTLVLVLGQR